MKKEKLVVLIAVQILLLAMYNMNIINNLIASIIIVSISLLYTSKGKLIQGQSNSTKENFILTILLIIVLYLNFNYIDNFENMITNTVSIYSIMLSLVSLINSIKGVKK